MKMTKTKLALASILTTGLLVQAQDDASGKDEVFELSPFSVDSSEDQGYRATTTLAGTRLNTNLGDIGSAISVITEEFFEDVGATDAATVLSYSLNTEIGGEQGNYTGGANQNNQRVNPQRTQRVRGLAAASLTRNYFLTDIPFDTYNTSRVTINRGPNSLLFGIGTPGGVIENSISRASVNTDSYKLSLRVGERGSNRETFDANKVLIDGRLGIRMMMMREDTKYKQRPAFEEDNRFTLSLQGVLSEGGDGILGRTSVRANLESGEIESSRPDVTPPIDYISGWFNPPNPAYDDVWGKEYIGQNEWAANGSFIPKYLPDTRGGAHPSTVIGQYRVPVFIGTQVVTDDPNATSFGGGGDASRSDIVNFQARYNWNKGVANPLGLPRIDFLQSGYFGPGTGFTAPTINDRSIWDNENRLLSGAENKVLQDFNAWNVTLEQSLFNGKGGLEISFDNQSYDTNQLLPFQESGLGVDVNQYWGDGTPNPNAGRPYILSQLSNDINEADSEAFRATGFYELDLSDREGWLGNVLGRHVFTGFYSDQTNTSRNSSTKFAWHSGVVEDFDAVGVITRQPGNVTGGRRSFNHLVYVGPSLANVNSYEDVRLNQTINVPNPYDGQAFRTRYWDPRDGMNKIDDWTVREVVDGAGTRSQVITSQVASLQSRWFGGNLVGLVGYREDDSDTFERISENSDPNVGPIVDYTLPDGQRDLSTNVLNTEPGLVYSGKSVTRSVVGHLPRIWNPFHELIKVSAHWSDSENFQPTSARRNIRGEVLPPPSGTTTEKGLSFTTAGGDLSIRLNWFKTQSIGATLPTGALNQVTNIGSLRPMKEFQEARLQGMPYRSIGVEGDPDFELGAYDYALGGLTEPAAIEDGTTDFGYSSYDELINAYRDAMPEPTRSLLNAGFDENGEIKTDPLLGRSATRDLVAEGFEVEIIGNLNENWRVSFNVGQQETTFDNSAQALAPFAEQAAKNLQDNGLWHLYDAPVLGVTSTVRSRFTGSVLTPLAAALAADGTVSSEQREWRVNLATNYRFANDGLLDGWSVGGAVRHQSKVAIGYPLTDEDGDNVFLPTLAAPYFGPAETSGDLWISHERKIWDGKMWKFQINYRNAIGRNTPIPFDANPDGTIARFRNPNPREVFITNTLSF